MHLVWLTFFLFFGIIRIIFRASDDVTAKGRMARLGPIDEYEDKYCDFKLEKEYKMKTFSPSCYEELWGILDDAWKNKRHLINQMDEVDQEVWRLLMEPGYPVPIFECYNEPNRDEVRGRLYKKYNWGKYYDEYGHHQWVYNWMRALNCLMTLHGKKSKRIADTMYTFQINGKGTPDFIMSVLTYDGRRDKVRYDGPNGEKYL